MTAYLHVAFYCGGRLVEIAKFKKQIDRASELDGRLTAEFHRLAMAYQQLHMRHFKMTGEIYSDPGPSKPPVGDKPYDA